MSIETFTSPIAAFLKGAFVQLSQADGKPGLSADDFVVVAKYAASLTSGTGAEKAERVKKWVSLNYGSRIPSWLTDVLVWLAYAYAKRKGFIA